MTEDTRQLQARRHDSGSRGRGDSRGRRDVSNTQLERSTAAYYHIQLEARRHGSGSRGRGDSRSRK